MITRFNIKIKINAIAFEWRQRGGKLFVKIH